MIARKIARYRIDRLRRYFDEGEGEGQGSGEGSGAGGEGQGSGDGAAGQGGEGSKGPDLSAQALEAIEALKKTGQEIPSALEKAVKELGRAREEAAKNRVEKKETEKRDKLLQAVASALGLENEEDLDPDKLKTESEELRTQVRELRLEKVFRTVADEKKMDADLAFALFRNSSEFRDAKIEDEESLRASLGSWADETLKAHPNLKAGPGAPSRNGNDFSGGTGGKTFTREEIRRMSPEEVNENWEAISKQMAAGQIK